MNHSFYHDLSGDSLSGKILEHETCQDILMSPEVELLPLLDAAFKVRKKYRGKEVSIQVINNAQNGYCPEDCHYCAQSKSSKADITEYPLKPDHEILNEAEQAYKNGALRYCMVFAGRGASQKRVEHLAELIKEIKSRYPLEVCVSPGLLDKDKARILKEAGLDRLNHNLNTSRRYYPEICSTHTYEDRLATLRAAKEVNIDVCSGVIIGMGETADDIIDTAITLRELNARAIPVNFFIDIKGTSLNAVSSLTPQYCLRVLCLYRFLNPDAEIRVAAGRESHLRSMQALSLYPADSLFMEGYLNTGGEGVKETHRMIRDAGFIIAKMTRPVERKTLQEAK